MNTKKLREKFKQEKPQIELLSLELGGTSLMSESAKGYKAHGTPGYTNFRRTQLTHQFSTNSTPEPSSSKKEKLSFTQTIIVSQKKTNVTHLSTMIKNSLGFREITCQLLASSQQEACLFIGLSESSRSSSLSSHFHACTGDSQNQSKGHNSLKFSM